MTPSRAIKAECAFCKNNNYFDCKSDICKLKDRTLSPLKRIKAHCISCSSEQSIYGAQECTGRLLNGKACPLHLYREGHNPNIKGNLNAKRNIEALKRYLQTKKETAFL